MNTVSTPVSAHVVPPASAANADHVGELGVAPAIVSHVEALGGWDSYEVWRRFIKDARDRRHQPE